MKSREAEPSEILAQLSGGERVSEDQKKQLHVRLEVAMGAASPDDWDFDEIYEVTLVLGRLNAEESLPLLERLLDSQESMTVCLALDILCLRWGRLEEQLQRVLTFAVGSVWDEDLDVQEKAISLLGEYLRQNLLSKRLSAQASRVVELLWSQFASSDESPVVRRAAYLAMLSAGGPQAPDRSEKKPPAPKLAIFSKLPRFESDQDIQKELEPEVIRSLLNAAALSEDPPPSRPPPSR